MTTSPPSERSPFGPDVSKKMKWHLDAHRFGLHDGSYRPAGCPACLFRDATWPGLAEEKMTP